MFFLCHGLFCWSLWAATVAALRMSVLFSQVLKEMGEYGVSMADAYSDMFRMGDPYSIFKVSLPRDTSHLFVLSLQYCINFLFTQEELSPITFDYDSV